VTLKREQQDAVKQILTLVLSDVRPAELILVDSVFDKQVDVGRKSDGLGFGEAIQVTLLTYAIAGVLGELATTAAKGFAKKWGEELAAYLKPGAGKAEPADGTILSSLRSAISERLRSEGTIPADADKVADTVIAVIATRPDLTTKLFRT